MWHALSLGTGLGRDQRVSQKFEQLFAALIAHNQPLLALAAHIADRQITEGIRIVDAGAAGEGKEIARQF